ncbi:DUF6308 family protein [Paenarthrobacter sp. A20]|uniref:DUF6308 family protein n=1 Tax=Paenarthrobacter sp. A20 TaxID=2817891 RepID=UPI00209E9D89|nr:DUF6308 family protein [Paenarthrobacter sp. A20]MCP1412932.1 hypothetical protein [Paenarthrobacter sp. A20]
MTEELYVGGAQIDFEEARNFARRYFGSEGRTWSYPAYDSYPGHPGPAVGHADLLAVALLNAHQKPVETYYGLESMLPIINGRLADPHLTGSLAEAGEQTIEALARLFGTLDEHKPSQVGLTKLSKVLHRKRPELIPLYDKNIYSCYVGEGRPLPEDDNRSWFNLAKLLMRAMKFDLESQIDSWRAIAALATGPAVTPLRAMDIIGWRLGAQIRDSSYLGEFRHRRASTAA